MNRKHTPFLNAIAPRTIRHRNVLLFLVLSLLVAASVWADPLDHWTRRHPFPSWAGAAFGADRFVTVGELGAIWSSSDGVAWSAQSSGTANSLSDVVFAQGRFVAVGAGGTILTSTNGLDWSPVPSGVTTSLAGVTYGNGIYVAVGPSGTVLTSGTGLSWTQQSGISASLALKSVAYGTNLLLAITGTGDIIESRDGLTWTAQPSVGGTPYHVGFLNNQFVIVDYGLKFSPDGTNWTYVNYVYPVLQAMTYVGGCYVGAGTGGSIQFSADGTNWSAATAYQSTYDLAAITCGNGTFVAAGGHGLIRSSTDRLNWPIRNQSLSNLGNLYGVKYLNHEFMVVGDFAVGPGGVGEDCPILCSPRPGSWYRRSSGSFNTFWDVAYGQGMYVIATASAGLRISTNGNDWVSVGSGLSSQLAGVTFANNLFVLTAWGGGIATSPDGLTWTARTSGSTRNLWGAAYGQGMYLAVGQSFSSGTGAYVTSGDGIHWTNHSLSANLRNIAYGGGAFVIVGDNGYLASSTTGLSWTPHASGAAGTIYGVCYGDGYFVAVGTSGFLATSPDGASWTPRASGLGNTFARVAYGNGTFVATADTGTIIQSASTLPLLTAKTNGSGVQLALAGGFDRAYLLLVTTNVAAGPWSSLTTLASGQRQFTDTDTVAARKFYRLTLP